MSKEHAKVDLWIKEIAPSNDLRRWYKNNPEKTKEFQKKYLAELKINSDSLQEVKKIIRSQKTTTLLYASKNSEPAHGIILKQALKD